MQDQQESAANTTTQLQRPQRLRLWPGVVIVSLQWLGRYVIPKFVPEALPYGALGGLAGGLAIVVWWLFFSRAQWAERLGAVALMAAGLFVSGRLLHVSVATAGMGFLFPMYAVPLVCLALVVWAVVTQGLSQGVRRVSMVVTIIATCGVWTLLRTGGITGGASSDFAWRWSKTSEDRLLARGDDALQAPLGRVASDIEADWPGFRGPRRDSVISGVRIETDWSASPPVEMWRRPIGPGWSSFAVRGDVLYTQEQRGDEEIVASYSVSTGEPVWRHRDPARFYESNGGAGPRGTPTLRDGRVYTFGATGILNALNADNGSVIWSRDVGADAEVKVPEWGFASSPLLLGDIVIVAAAGRLVAYDLASGEPRWLGPANGGGYSSPHLLTFDGVEQILLMSVSGATSVAPYDGTTLWEHTWKQGTRIVQPALTADGDLLMSGGEGSAMRRITIVNGTDSWHSEERWTSNRLKPYFNDFVVHDGHAFGFDGRILACIDVEDGARKWKGGRYGHGQLVLFPDQDLLLVLSEDGELALVAAKSDQFTELARFPAIDGKTWNHPVLVRDVLLARNGEEMVAFRLTFASADELARAY